MQIGTTCSKCGKRYLLDPALLGQKIRCPNSTCRAVIEVRDDAPPQKPDSSTTVPMPTIALPNEAAASEQGEVTQMLPVLSAESAEPTTPLANEPAASPPPARSRKERRPVAPTAAPKLDEPLFVEDELAQLPPVRRGRKEKHAVPVNLPPRRRTQSEPADAGSGSGEVPAVEEPPEEDELDRAIAESERRRQRRRKLFLTVVIALPVLVFLVVGLASWFVRSKLAEGEQNFYTQAQEAFSAGKYREAHEAWQQLLTKFPASPHAAEAKFLVELSDLKQQIHVARVAPRVGMPAVEAFSSTHADNPWLKTHGKAVLESVDKLVEEYHRQHLAEVNEELPKHWAELEQFLAKVTPKLAADLKPEDTEKWAGLVRETKSRFAQYEHKQRVLVKLRKLAEEPTFTNSSAFRRLVKQEARNLPELETLPEVQTLAESIPQKLFDQVRYEASSLENMWAILAVPVQGGYLDRLPLGALVYTLQKQSPEDTEPSLLVTPALGEATPVHVPGDPVVLALARGMLYALSQSNGQVRWALRVGIDIDTLPTRVPATALLPELVLVVSGDAHTLTALEAQTGLAYWTCSLGAPCLGRPVVVEGRVFVPTFQGKVHEIDLLQGRTLGRYHLGARLTVGGGWLESEKLLYFPADEGGIFVLDPEKRRCVSLLLTEHMSGSLRAGPLLIPPARVGDEAGKSWLVLCPAQGADATLVHAYPLPVPPGVAKLTPLAPTWTVPGVSWYRPALDPEKFAFLTDRGVLGLFGLPQPKSTESGFFPLLSEPLTLSPTSTAERLAQARAQVVHMEDTEYWLLAHGALQRYQLSTDRQKGVQLSPAWPSAKLVGALLHQAQTSADGTVLYLTTQAPTSQACLVTALQAEDGKMRWQRQLGLVCQGEPLLVPRGEQQVVLTLEQGGGVFLVDPLSKQLQGQLVARPTKEIVVGEPYLSLGKEPGLVYEFVCLRALNQLGQREAPYKLLIRSLKLSTPESPTAPLERTVPLEAPLAGRPVLLGSSRLLVPLQDGTLWQFNLASEKSDLDKQVGPNWRVETGTADGQARLVALSEVEFVVSDGQRGLTRWRWQQGVDFHSVPAGKHDARRPALTLLSKLADDLLLLPGPAPTDEPTLCLADQEGRVTLYRGEKWTVQQSWQLGQAVTSGPFAVGKYIGCIVEKRKLVWLEPGRPEPIWQMSFASPVVGLPRALGSVLILAEQSGRYHFLALESGRPLPGGYALKSSVAPVASVVPFGKTQALAPLSDGTLLVLPVPSVVPTVGR